MASRSARGAAAALATRQVLSSSRAPQVRKSCLGAHCLFVFIAPPSHEELERRLRGRGTETEEKVVKRLANAVEELRKSKTEGLFDVTVVNDDLEAAVLEIAAAAEGHLPGTAPGAREALAALRAAAAAAAAAAPAAAAPVATAPEAAAAAAAAAAALAAPPAAPADAPAAPTAALLDFGFGASAGAGGAAAKGMPVRAYLDAAVVPALREGLRALNGARPDDPLQFLAEFLLARRGGGGGGGPAAAAPGGAPRAAA